MSKAHLCEQDIEELFSDIGEVKSAAVELNAAGHSKCWAVVIYKRKADALKAIEQYNGVPLDGKPLKITEMTAPGAATTAAALQARWVCACGCGAAMMEAHTTGPPWQRCRMGGGCGARL